MRHPHAIPRDYKPLLTVLKFRLDFFKLIAGRWSPSNGFWTKTFSFSSQVLRAVRSARLLVCESVPLRGYLFLGNLTLEVALGKERSSPHH